MSSRQLATCEIQCFIFISCFFLLVSGSSGVGNIANEPNNLSITAGVNESDDFQENHIEGNSINNNPIQQDDAPRDELLENYFNQIDDEEQEFYDENVLFPAANVTTAETDDEIRGKFGSSFHCQSF